MVFSKYFKTGQKVILRSKTELQSPGRYDSLTLYFYDGKPGHFDLILPYGTKGEEAYPFAPEMPFEILSDAFGLGIRMNGHFDQQLRDDLIRVKIDGNLQAFQRRTHRRLDLPIGLRYTRGKGTLRSFREQWERNVQILEKGKDSAQLSRFPRTQVNLSAGGIRFALKAPVEIADLALLLIELESGPPICTLAEVVWVDDTEVNGRLTTGMRFANIMESDQKRIEEYIKEKAPIADKQQEA